MRTTLQLLSILASLLFIPVSCRDLFQADKPDSPPDNALDVLQAREHAGEEDVWVQGYIVGVASSNKKISLEGPFTKNTNLVLGESDTTTVRDHCLSVELKAGAIRDALNLVDNPDQLGRKVYIKGDLVDAYYGIPGLKSPSEYGFY